MNNIDRIGQIKVPVLLINGDKDVKDFLEISNRLNREISSSTKVIIENAGHLANLEAPELFLDLVLKHAVREQRKKNSSIGKAYTDIDKMRR